MVPDQSASEDDDGTDVKHVYHPSIRPPAILFVLTVLATALIGGYILGAGYEQSTEETLLWILGFIAAVLLLRLVVKIFVLTRTRYVITPTQLRREFSLFYRVRVREVPLSQLRGIELSRDTTQALFGFGDLQFLTAGMNQSLGFLTFEQIPDPVEHRDEIREQFQTER